MWVWWPGRITIVFAQSASRRRLPGGRASGLRFPGRCGGLLLRDILKRGCQPRNARSPSEQRWPSASGRSRGNVGGTMRRANATLAATRKCPVKFFDRVYPLRPRVTKKLRQARFHGAWRCLARFQGGSVGQGLFVRTNSMAVVTNSVGSLANVPLSVSMAMTPSQLAFFSSASRPL